MEAEYRALATTAADITWLQHLLHDIGIQLDRRPLLLCDNKSAIHLSHNLVFHARTKHIEIDCHFIREKVTIVALHLHYLPTSKQIADILTKSLPRHMFNDFRYKLGVHSHSLPSLKGGKQSNELFSKQSNEFISKNQGIDQASIQARPLEDIKPLDTNRVMHGYI